MRVRVKTFKEGDEEKWLKIINCSIQGSGREPLRLKDVKERIRSPFFDPKAVFFAYIDGEPVGICEAAAGAFFEIAKGHINSFHVLPKYRGTRVGKALHQRAMGHFEAKGLKEVEAAFLDDEPYLETFFSSMGYSIGRIYLIMETDLKGIRGTAAIRGVAVQPLSKGQLRIFVDVANRAFSDAFSYYDFEPATCEGVKRQMQTYRVGYDDVKIAYSGNEPVGYVYTINDSIAGIGVISEYRRKNVGALLLTEGLKHVHSKGFMKASAGVNQENKPAVAFFRKHGFQKTKRITFMRKTLRNKMNMRQKC
jgi:ribosomal protein S18 acetylase RimI-like enzyme